MMPCVFFLLLTYTRFTKLTVLSLIGNWLPSLLSTQLTTPSLFQLFACSAFSTNSLTTFHGHFPIVLHVVITTTFYFLSPCLLPSHSLPLSVYYSFHLTTKHTRIYKKNKKIYNNHTAYSTFFVSLIATSL